MKRTILPLLLILSLLLSGCGTAAAPAQTAAPAPAQTPVPTSVLEPDAALLELLGAIRDRMHPGTAGASLRAAALAAELLDWAAESTLSPGGVQLSLDTYLGALDEGARAEFLQQLEAVHSSCTLLLDAGTQAEELLGDAGVTPRHSPWPQEAVDRADLVMQLAGVRQG